MRTGGYTSYAGSPLGTGTVNPGYGGRLYGGSGSTTPRGLYTRPGTSTGGSPLPHQGSPLKERPTTLGRSTSPSALERYAYSTTTTNATSTSTSPSAYVYDRPAASIRERPSALGSIVGDNPYSLGGTFKSTFSRGSPYSSISTYGAGAGAGAAGLASTPHRQRVGTTGFSTPQGAGGQRFGSPPRQRIRGTSFREEYSGLSPRSRMRRAPSMLGTPGTLMVPQQAPEDYGKYSIVLDLDETLIYARDGPLYARPGVEELLSFLGRKCEAIAWTAGLRAYAQAVLANIDKTSAIKHCIYRHSKWFTNEPGYQKDLSLLGRPLDRTLIIENTPDCIRANRENGILVADYEGGEVVDETIPRLTEFLKGLVSSNMPVPQYLAQCPLLSRRRVSTDRGDHIECYWLEVNNPPGSPGGGSTSPRYNRDLYSYGR